MGLGIRSLLVRVRRRLPLVNLGLVAGNLMAVFALVLALADAAQTREMLERLKGISDSQDRILVSILSELDRPVREVLAEMEPPILLPTRRQSLEILRAVPRGTARAHSVLADVVVPARAGEGTRLWLAWMAGLQVFPELALPGRIPEGARIQRSLSGRRDLKDVSLVLLEVEPPALALFEQRHRSSERGFGFFLPHLEGVRVRASVRYGVNG